ncbi:single-stranded-DNA-specific exonuclease RecJ [Lysobacter sp. CAU 1642]|uniref:Single-stranded-DNA-specific exonuclease RecJ n=1 Tax=Pseudomarimonas salicorniae TaxID=2933270 RepID=A0ABT0GHT2_9GAMM|nr:single-stranded-DNA-specific exonuclease RecJ [Lysobacter sp. CAU 1642]
MSTEAWGSDQHPVIARVLAARGVVDPESARLSLRSLLAPASLGGLGQAVELLVRALDENWRIRIVGDFDCDGATGTAVAVRGLRLLGARQVEFDVPHRMRHGYGLSAELVAEWPAPHPELIVTVDNGISSHAGVDAARARGMRVLVTDHHLPGETLPAADAIVNPNLPGDGFPSKSLAGVGVMFYLLLALRARLRDLGRYASGEEPDLSCLLDLVALGTVADLVSLDRNNRILVAAGLARMRRGQLCPGLAALVEVSGRQCARLTASDLGFALGPRINAAGRLEDMRLGIRCLLSDEPDEAREAALQLNAINAERRERQQAMLDEAEAALEGCDERLLRGEVGVTLFSQGWHAGVIGLVASKMKDRLHRPVIAFAPADEDGEGSLLRGSARSIEGFHIRDALAAVQARHPGLIGRFGGHAMAAGLSLERDALQAFSAAFDEIACAALSEEALRAEILSDGELAASEISRDLAEALIAAGPFGQGFPEPCFDGEFEVSEWRVVAERHLKLSLRHPGGSMPVSAIHFGGWQGNPPPGRVHLVYQLALDDYRDRHGVQLMVRECWPA